MRLSVRVTSSDPYTIHLHQTPPLSGVHAGPSIIIRTHSALTYLHSKLLEHAPDLIVPPLLQFPTPDRQRAHVERFLNRVGKREVLLKLPDVKNFFTENAQIPEESKKPNRFNLEFLNPIIKPHYEKGLRLFRPVDALDGHDQEDWDRRHAQVLRSEQQVQALSEAFRDMVDAETKLTQAIDNCTSQFLEAIEIPDLPELFENLRGLAEGQVEKQVMVFLDVLSEQDAYSPIVKKLMNSRTEMLAHYASVGRKTQKSRDKLAKARSKIPSFTNVQSAQLERAAAEDQKIAEKLDEERARFLNHHSHTITELFRYQHEDKDAALEKAMDEFVSTQLACEEAKEIKVLEWLKGVDMEMVEKMKWTGSPSPLIISGKRF